MRFYWNFSSETKSKLFIVRIASWIIFESYNKNVIEQKEARGTEISSKLIEKMRVGKNQKNLGRWQKL